MRLDPAPRRVGHAPLSVSGGHDGFVALDALGERVARWAAPLPRTRQPDDAERRAAAAVACALSESLRERTDLGGREAAARAMPEDVDALAAASGLTRAQARAAIATLVACGAAERISTGGRGQLRLVSDVVTEAPALARIAWPRVRERLRAAGASVLPAQAVLRALARQTGAVPAGTAAPVVSCTQESLAHETLLGRTAVVTALAALVRAEVIARAARRGTWTECQLLPAAFAAASPVTPLASAIAAPVPSDREVPIAAAHEHAVLGASPTPAAPAALGDATPAGVAAADPAGLALELGGVRVRLAPGTTVDAPAGVTISIEVDAAGRRFVQLGPGIRLGPLA